MSGKLTRVVAKSRIFEERNGCKIVAIERYFCIVVERLQGAELLWAEGGIVGKKIKLAEFNDGQTDASLTFSNVRSKSLLKDLHSSCRDNRAVFGSSNAG